MATANNVTNDLRSTLQRLPAQERNDLARHIASLVGAQPPLPPSQHQPAAAPPPSHHQPAADAQDNLAHQLLALLSRNQRQPSDIIIVPRGLFASSTREDSTSKKAPQVRENCIEIARHLPSVTGDEGVEALAKLGADMITKIKSSLTSECSRLGGQIISDQFLVFATNYHVPPQAIPAALRAAGQNGSSLVRIWFNDVRNIQVWIESYKASHPNGTTPFGFIKDCFLPFLLTVYYTTGKGMKERHVQELYDHALNELKAKIGGRDCVMADDESNRTKDSLQECVATKKNSLLRSTLKQINLRQTLCLAFGDVIVAEVLGLMQVTIQFSQSAIKNPVVPVEGITYHTHDRKEVDCPVLYFKCPGLKKDEAESAIQKLENRLWPTHQAPNNVLPPTNQDLNNVLNQALNNVRPPTNQALNNVLPPTNQDLNNVLNQALNNVHPPTNQALNNVLPPTNHQHTHHSGTLMSSGSHARPNASQRASVSTSVSDSAAVAHVLEEPKSPQPSYLALSPAANYVNPEATPEISAAEAHFLKEALNGEVEIESTESDRRDPHHELELTQLDSRDPPGTLVQDGFEGVLGKGSLIDITDDSIKTAAADKAQQQLANAAQWEEKQMKASIASAFESFMHCSNANYIYIWIRSFFLAAATASAATASATATATASASASATATGRAAATAAAAAATATAAAAATEYRCYKAKGGRRE